MAADYYVGDVGVALVLTLADDDGPVDLADATAATLFCQRPDAAIVAVPATWGQGGVVTVTFGPDILTTVGTWKYQAVVEGPAYTLHSAIGRFKVGASLDELG